MAWRAIQESVDESESLATLSHFAERLFWRMVAKSDHKGRLPASAPKIRARCIPILPDITDDEIHAALEELRQAGRILIYEGLVGSRRVRAIQITEFEENQPRDATRGVRPSEFPDPPAATRGNSRRLARRDGDGDGEGEGKAPNGASPAKSPADAVKSVYDHWRTARGKTDRRYDQISDNRRQKIKARLREFPADELKRAIDGVALDPWEDRPRHDDLTVIFRNREQVERFLSFHENGRSRSRADRMRERVARGDL